MAGINGEELGPGDYFGDLLYLNFVPAPVHSQEPVECLYCQARLYGPTVSLQLENTRFGLHLDCAEVFATHIITAARQGRELTS